VLTCRSAAVLQCCGAVLKCLGLPVPSP